MTTTTPAITEPVTTTTASGFTFTLRPPHLVPERLRRPLTNKLVLAAESVVSDGTSPQVGDEDKPAVLAATLTAADLETMEAINDLLAVALVLNWSLPVPVTLDAVLDLPAQDYDALRTAVAPYVTLMLPDFSPTPEAGTPTTP